jgi:flagella basal body P-ring formation protein FlgA
MTRKALLPVLAISLLLANGAYAQDVAQPQSQAAQDQISATLQTQRPSSGTLATIAMLPVPMLKSSVTVASGYVRLGDLFDNAGAHAGDIIANAPPAGGHQVFDASWLASTASEHGLNWQAPSAFTHVEVTRASTVIGSDQIAQQLAEKIAGGRPDEKVRLDSMVKLYVPVGSSTDIAIDNLQIDQASGRFNADLRVPANDPTAQSIRVNGIVQTTVQVPTLNRAVQVGDIIGPDDISWTTVPANQLPSGNVTNPNQLVGYAARRSLRPGTPLRTVDVQQPILVHRNDLVEVVVEQPGLYITVEGKALEDGGKGQVISVSNLQSKRILQAVVQAGGQVSIPMPGATNTTTVAAAD